MKHGIKFNLIINTEETDDVMK